MTEHALHGPEVCAAIQKQGGAGMAEFMGAEFFREASRPDLAFDHAPDCTTIQLTTLLR